MKRVLGIDPGSRKTGFGILTFNKGKSYYIASGCIETQETTFSKKLYDIFKGVNELISIHQPEEVAIEQVFMASNPNSALKLGHARGSAIVAAVKHNLTVHEYTAKRIKQCVTGNGGASKHQVQYMITSILKLNQLPQPDAADALAVAWCHIQNNLHTLKSL